MRAINVKRSVCASALLLLGSAAYAAPCTNASLSGAYGFQEQGMHDEAAGFVEFRSIGIMKFDGRGGGIENFTLWFSDRSINPVSVPVVYVVRPDCSFTLTYVGLGETFEGVIVANGLKLLYMETSGDLVRSGQAEKVKSDQ